MTDVETTGKLTVLDILRRLDRSNCKKCGAPTCMAFAALVVQGKMKLDRCPTLPPEDVQALSGLLAETHKDAQARRDQMIAGLSEMMAGVDLAVAAGRVGGTVRGQRLEVRCLGKAFELDAAGNLFSECHVNPWVQLPLLLYVSRCEGREVAGKWLPFSRLDGARDWDRFFAHRCEDAIRRIADLDPELFLDTLELFSGQPVDRGTEEIYSTADHVVVLHPLPRLPVLVAYWRPEGEFASSLNLLFDSSAAYNLGPEGIFRLLTGIVEMLHKIMARHGLVVDR